MSIEFNEKDYPYLDEETKLTIKALMEPVNIPKSDNLELKGPLVYKLLDIESVVEEVGKVANMGKSFKVFRDSFEEKSPKGTYVIFGPPTDEY